MRVALLIGLGLLLCLVAGCTKATILALSDPLPIDGTYASTAEVGGLGNLSLIIRKREKSVRVFEAELSSDTTAEVEVSEGTGTLGEDHLILNFEIGSPDDYYFQGFVQTDSGGAVTGLIGTFIFSDQPEQLAVEFTRTGDAPPLPPDETVS